MDQHYTGKNLEQSQVKTLCNVVQAVPDNAQEKILFNVVLNLCTLAAFSLCQYCILTIFR